MIAGGGAGAVDWHGKDVITAHLTITASTQAERVANLIWMRNINGAPMKFSELEAFMLKRNVTMSKSTWHALRNDEYRVVMLEILDGVAAFFKVPRAFLMYEDATIPEVYQRNLAAVEEARTNDAVEQIDRILKTFSPERRKIIWARQENYRRRELNANGEGALAVAKESGDTKSIQIKGSNPD